MLTFIGLGLFNENDISLKGLEAIKEADQLIAKNVNWLSGSAPAHLKCQAVIRYRHKPAKCQLKKITKTTYAVKFKEPQRAIAPGQSVVFYSGNEVLGGGVISLPDKGGLGRVR